MSSWLLQANPDQFDVTTYVERFTDIYWSIKKEAWQRKAAVGDEVFIWRAMGSAKVESGVIACGYITEPATAKDQVRYPENIADELWRSGYSELSKMKIGIHLTNARVSGDKGMLLKAYFLSDPILAKSQIITVRSGAVFMLSESQARRVRELWSSEEQTQERVTGGSIEGAIIERIHRFRERDHSLVVTAKNRFLEKHGELFCTICSFSYSRTYGDLGEGYIEAHHVKPISERDGAEETKVEDLAIVCANCHRMIHRDRDYGGNHKKLLELLGGHKF